MIKIITLILFVGGMFLSSNLMLWGADYALISEIGASARMIGIGNIEGFSEHSDSLFENPAGLLHIENYSATLFSTTFMNEVVFNVLSGAMTTEYGTFGVGYMSQEITQIPVTYETESNEYDVQSYFDYKNSITKLGYQTWIQPALSLGVNFCLYNHDIGEVKGSGMNLESGLIYEQDPFTYSYSIKNIWFGQAIQYTNNQTESVPLVQVFSVKYNFYGLDYQDLGVFDKEEDAIKYKDSLSESERAPIIEALEGDQWQVLIPKKGLADVSFFGQFKMISSQFLLSYGCQVKPSMVENLYFSIGSKAYLVAQEPNQNLTMGLGLELMGININYAYESSAHMLFNSKHYISMEVGI